MVSGRCGGVPFESPVIGGEEQGLPACGPSQPPSSHFLAQQDGLAPLPFFSFPSHSVPKTAKAHGVNGHYHGHFPSMAHVFLQRHPFLGTPTNQGFPPQGHIRVDLKGLEHHDPFATLTIRFGHAMAHAIEGPLRANISRGIYSARDMLAQCAGVSRCAGIEFRIADTYLNKGPPPPTSLPQFQLGLRRKVPNVFQRPSRRNCILKGSVVALTGGGMGTVEVVFPKAFAAGSFA